MGKWISLLMTALVGVSTYSNASTGEVNFDIGYRNDRLEWKHSFPSSDPIVSTKQEFKDIDILQIGVDGRTTLGCNLYLRGGAYFGWVLDGTFKEKNSIYGSYGCGFSDHSKHLVDDQYVYGINVAVGYPFYFCDCTLTLSPVVGYSVDNQNFSFDGSSEEDSSYGSSSVVTADEASSCNLLRNGDCCNHKFNNRWYGPFVGFDLLYRPYGDCWSFWGEFEYHFGSFRGRRDHTEAFSFFGKQNRNSNNVHGYVIYVGTDYDVSECWTLGLSFKYQDFRTSRGHSHDASSYNSEFGSGSYGYCGSHIKTKHDWRSYTINVTAGYLF